MVNNVQLYKGDCLEVMKGIPSKSVDLALIDPPYNISKAEWDKWKTIKEYVDFMGLAFKECERVLKDNGSFYFFHNDFLQMVELQNYINQNTGFKFKSMLTWEKYQTNKQYYGRNVLMGINSTQKRNYRNMAEYCLYYTLQDETGLKYIDEKYITPRNPFKRAIEKAKQETGMTTIQIAEKGKFYGKVNHGGSVSNWLKGSNIPTEEQYEKMKSFLPLKEEYEALRKEYEALRKEYEGLRYTFNVFDTDKTTTFLIPPAPKKGHITPKPVDLLEYIIKTSSNEGDVVLDCFMGSGSTGVACMNTNRKFIGIEKEKKYFEIAKKRIVEHGNG